MNRLTKALITISVISTSHLVLIESAHAHIKMTLGNPTKIPSKMTFKLDLGRHPRTGDLIYSEPITIDVTSKDCGEKAETIKMAVEPTVDFGTRGNRDVNPVLDGCMVTFARKTVKSLHVTADTSGEETKLEAVNKQRAKEGGIDGKFIEIATNLSGVDADGNESIFAASLGFETPSETIFASSIFPFSQLGGNDIDNWLSTIYNDLKGQIPTIYQPNLTLDLISDEITFNFPFEDMLPGGFISTETTDTNVSASISIETETVPEPSTTLSFIALGTLGATSTLKRKLKSSQSAEEETTKVS